jgi:hypothetical protein
LDFEDVKGHEYAKRGLEVAAVGVQNFHMLTWPAPMRHAILLADTSFSKRHAPHARTVIRILHTLPEITLRSLTQCQRIK